MLRKILFIYALMIALLLSTSHAKENILIVTEEWAPYNYMKNEEITGVSTEIVKSIFNQLDRKYKIRLFPSMRSMNLLNTRPYTMLFSFFRTPQREPLYKWVGPLIDGSIYFYKIKGSNIHIKTFDDLKDSNLSICTRQAGLVPQLLIEKGFTNLDNTAVNGVQIYKKLLVGRCDLAISESDLGARYILKSLGLKLEDVFEKIPFVFYSGELYLAGSKDIPDEEIEKMQRAFEKIKANGTYDEIIQKYH